MKFLPPIPTIGGPQWWSDVLLFRDWRIQRKAGAETHRLLDGWNLRHAAGTLAECRDRLAAIRIDRGLVPMSGKAVLLLHGLIRARSSMRRLGRYLANKGFKPFYVGYASIREPIEVHAEHLARILEELDGADEIHLVGHSMGGLVIRAALALRVEPRVRRVVMLGTPNHGAEMADMLHRWSSFRLLFGPAGQQLVTGRDGAALKLPTTLPVPFGVIAGGKGDAAGYSPLLPGDNDGTVTTASAQMEGGDFKLVRCLHSFLPADRKVAELTAAFLTDGKFTS